MPTKNKPVKNPTIKARREILKQEQRRAKMTRHTATRAGIDTAEILKNQYALHKQMTARIAQTTQSQSVVINLAGYDEIQKQNQIKELNDQINYFKIKQERGVSSEITAPAIEKLQRLRQNLPERPSASLDVSGIPQELEAPEISTISEQTPQKIKTRTMRPRTVVEASTATEVVAQQEAPRQTIEKPSRLVNQEQFMITNPEITQQIVETFEQQQRKLKRIEKMEKQRAMLLSNEPMKAPAGRGRPAKKREELIESLGGVLSRNPVEQAQPAQGGQVAILEEAKREGAGGSARQPQQPEGERALPINPAIASESKTRAFIDL